MDLDQLSTALASHGYHLALNGPPFTCDITCGVSVLPAHLPRPRGTGASWRAAVDSAIDNFAEAAKGYGTADRAAIGKAAGVLRKAVG